MKGYRYIRRMIIYIYDEKKFKIKEFHVDSKSAKAIETLLNVADYPSGESEGRLKFVPEESE